MSFLVLGSVKHASHIFPINRIVMPLLRPSTIANKHLKEPASIQKHTFSLYNAAKIELVELYSLGRYTTDIVIRSLRNILRVEKRQNWGARMPASS